MKLMITGDSHTGCLHLGIQELRAQNRFDPEVDISVIPLGGGHLLVNPFFEETDTEIRVTEPEYLPRMATIPPRTPQFDAIGLSMPLWSLRVVRTLGWAQYALSERVEGLRPISGAEFRHLVLTDQAHILRLIEALHRKGHRVFAVAAPTFFRDNPVLRILPPAMAIRMAETYRDIMKAELTARGVDFIDIPAQCRDDEGFMLQEYRYEDPADHHHANRAYGALIVRDIQTWARAALTRAA